MSEEEYLELFFYDKNGHEMVVDCRQIPLSMLREDRPFIWKITDPKIGGIGAVCINLRK